LVSDYWTFEGIAGFEPPRIAQELTRLLSQPHLGAGWIAIVDGVAAGYLLAVYVFSLEHRGVTAEIDEFFVSSSRRGSGIGVDLLKAAESEFTRAGLTNVSLQVARNNDAGRRFYRARGYTARAGYELLDKMLTGAANAR
jgi:ribosomal protein S18 acetylase RimI-like enzyme